MKITFILPVLSQNGGNRVVAIYAEKLVEMGHDVRLISQKPAQYPASRQVKDLVKRRPGGKPDSNRLPNTTPSATA